MSFKTRFIKIAIKLTPDFLVLWIANLVLKGIAELSDFIFDLETRTASVQLTLLGEELPIKVTVDGFAIVQREASYYFILPQAHSNRLWLNNILARLIGKEWKLPAMPQYQAQIDLIAELLQEEKPEQIIDIPSLSKSSPE